MGFRIDKAKNELRVAWQKAWVENVGENDRAWYHDYTDMFVEWRRHTPYSIGHIVQFTWPIRLFAYGVTIAWLFS